MGNKRRVNEYSAPILVPIAEEQFYIRIRVIIKEEIKAIALGGELTGMTQINGLIYKPLYDINEVRQLFGNVSRTTIYEWIKFGILKPKKMKGRIFFLWEDIERHLRTQNRATCDQPGGAGTVD